MSIIHFQTFGPYPYALALGLLDQGNGRFATHWYYHHELTLPIVTGHEAFFSVEENRIIVLVVDMVETGVGKQLNFFVGSVYAGGLYAKAADDAEALAAKGMMVDKPGNTCSNPLCGSLPCTNPLTPVLSCSPTKECVAGEGKQIAASSMKTAKDKGQRPKAKKSASNRRK